MKLNTTDATQAKVDFSDTFSSTISEWPRRTEETGFFCVIY
jgi:hypothetical protein